ncbi:uncharacterized protein IL334_004521 [Kwoniella shivajii]|uniref:TauD/TfdA-like domain-containing protein n=1 Tax=Kwoniella shivajii TaxID=564305 RepID=A0ABZ1D2H1_9TREE|nr:hypothetical protein IL334_004521 [Kwoniella shivajii]
MTVIAAPQELDEPLYPAYMPTLTNEIFPEHEPFEHDDPASRADPTFPNLLGSKAVAKPVTPLFGSEICGIQLTELSPEGLDELGLLVAQRGFAVFRNQNWKDSGFKKQLDIARHFGPLHKHPVQPRPATETEISVIYQSAAEVRRINYWGNRVSGVNWHADQTYERQPPAVTFFGVLENQGWCGGDTIIGDALRREAINTSHPLVTRHPVTGDEVLFVNEVFTTSIEGMKVEESDNLLRFLFAYIARGADFQARVKWEEGTVILWDQRRAQHSATLDTPHDRRRHMIRITPLGGRPIPATRK